MSRPYATPTPADIRAMMDRHRLTQAALAALMDPPVRHTTVGRWLAGTRPYPRHATQLRRLIGTGGLPGAEPAEAGAVAPDGIVRTYVEAEAAWEEEYAERVADADPEGASTAATVLRVLRGTRRRIESEQKGGG